jgi:hypothetical protein
VFGGFSTPNNSVDLGAAIFWQTHEPEVLVSRIVLATFAVSLTACVSAHGKQSIATAAESPRTSCAATGPFLASNGVVVQPSPCGAPKASQSPKCQSAAPRYVVNGVPLFREDDVETCEKPTSRDSR